MTKDKLVEQMLKEKGDTNNTIDLNAYGNGLIDMFDKASIIIYQRFYHELVKIAKNNKDKNMVYVPEFLDMQKAINILEKLYPKLKNN